jgi:lipopolysaccharide/colanic/teichoic acid biosynthesis glycosyltransferase
MLVVPFALRSGISRIGWVAAVQEVDAAHFKGDRAAKLLLGRAAKQLFDVIVAASGLVLFSPIYLLSSLAIILDSRGPIVLSHVRHAYGDKIFRVYKFRSTTMPYSAPEASRHGSRLTRVGRILRLSGIDGLPQLINVLRGEMSIVGPRPYTTPPGAIFEERIARISWLRDIKPGLTGWAQVHGYGDKGNSFEMMRRRMEYDLFYVEHWSFLLDMKIILMTLCAKKTYTPTEWMTGR